MPKLLVIHGAGMNMRGKSQIEVFGKIDEITALIFWIANEECSFTTGAVFDASEGTATY